MSLKQKEDCSDPPLSCSNVGKRGNALPVHEYTENISQIRTQLERVYYALKIKPMTMKEVDVYTFIMRESVCRHIKTLKDSTRIALIRKRCCSITNHIAGEYSADKSLFPKDNQLKFFEID